MLSDEELARWELAQEVEFVGGPIDGHRQTLPPEIPAVVYFRTGAVLKRTPWLIRLLNLISRHPAEAFPVAIYELRLREDQWVFCYWGRRVATEHRLSRRRAWLVAESIEQY